MNLGNLGDIILEIYPSFHATSNYVSTFMSDACALKTVLTKYRIVNHMERTIER